FAAGHIFFHYCFEGDFAYGISMLPTLSAFGNYVIINKSYRRGRGVEVGDIVSFKHPVREGEYAVKRVLGLEGDFVLMYTPGANDTMLQVPKGHCWVIGDDLPHSRDSRTFGPLPMALISGKVIAK
ncbi:LexA/Signal peptidase, partial [Dissoconium aciculare CBS 342.82]|uniref:LexA/Signal peptidase n=1 Tax=Dissoconium aciculare CBS 342.82 TaxID=1314786 RepID=A0A6J3MCA4_9PEZI